MLGPKFLSSKHAQSWKPYCEFSIVQCTVHTTYLIHSYIYISIWERAGKPLQAYFGLITVNFCVRIRIAHYKFLSNSRYTYICMYTYYTYRSIHRYTVVEPESDEYPGSVLTPKLIYRVRVGNWASCHFYHHRHRLLHTTDSSKMHLCICSHLDEPAANRKIKYKNSDLKT
jgi:hypothetical protein